MYRQFFRSFWILNGRLCMDNFIDTLCCNSCTRKHDRHHCQHQKWHNNHHCISDKCSHCTDLHRSCINLVRTYPYNSYGKYIHDHHHTRHHKCHDTVCKKHSLCQLFIRTVKTFFFFFLTAKCANNGKSCKNLTRNQVDIVDQLLHQFEFWHSHRHQYHDISKNHKNCQNNDPAHSGSGLHNFDHTTDTKDRCIGNHTKKQHRYHLDLLNIVRASRN